MTNSPGPDHPVGASLAKLGTGHLWGIPLADALLGVAIRHPEEMGGFIAKMRIPDELAATASLMVKAPRHWRRVWLFVAQPTVEALHITAGPGRYRRVLPARALIPGFPGAIAVTSAPVVAGHLRVTAVETAGRVVPALDPGTAHARLQRRFSEYRPIRHRP